MLPMTQEVFLLLLQVHQISVVNMSLGIIRST
jgi:hypothetical protein